MRVLFLTQYFPPEKGAPQTRLLETALNLQAAGHEVRVLTGFPNYPLGIIPPGYRGRLWMREAIEGIPVLRLWVYAAANRGFARRTLNHISLAATTLAAMPFLRWRPDVICVEMHPIFLCVTAMFFDLLRGVPYVMDAGDLIPEQAVALGAITNPLAIRATRRLSVLVSRRASEIIAFTSGIARAMQRRGVPPERVTLIYYGANTEIFEHPEQWQPLPEELDAAFDGRLTVTYAGTHGMAHGLEAAVEAARLLAGEGDIQFLFVGDGSEKAGLQQRARSLGLTNVRFFPAVTRGAMPNLLSRTDICLSTLRPLPLFKDISLPSKIFELMASGRPIVHASEGESSEILRQAAAAIIVEPGNARAIAQAVLDLRADPIRRVVLGENGRRFMLEHWNRQQQSRLFEAVLRRAARRREPPSVFRAHRLGRKLRSGLGAARLSATPRSDDVAVSAPANEVERIRAAYSLHDHRTAGGARYSDFNRGNLAIREEWRSAARRMLARHAVDLPSCRVLDVGCGVGGFLNWLAVHGVAPERCFGVDLLDERLVTAQRTKPGMNFALADARSLPYASGSFDLIVVSALFSSILDDAVANALAQEIIRVLKPGGEILWNDIRYPNPWNKQIRPYSHSAIRRLFPGFETDLTTVTVLPQLVRRMGPLAGPGYSLLRRLPVLRVRFAGLLRRPSHGAGIGHGAASASRAAYSRS